jgi:putative transposase
LILHAYLGGIVRNLGGVPLAIGGIEDHAHLLIGLRATHRLDYVMRDIKSGSSDWAHAIVGKKTFAWQPGYFGVTVSPSHIERVKRYILNQKEHHRHKTFKDEYVEMLTLAGVEYDERYVW